MSLYGTRDAENWGLELAGTLTHLGMKQGKSSPCVFYCYNRNLSATARGDDIIAEGIGKDVRNSLGTRTKFVPHWWVQVPGWRKQRNS